MVILQDFWAWALIAVAVAVVIGFVVVSTQQAAQHEAERRRLAELYDRRFAIYMAFHELLLAAVTRTDVLAKLQCASAARVQCRFLLNDAIGALLDDVMTQVLLLRTDINPGLGASGADAAHGQHAPRHKDARVRLLDRIDDLAAAFEPFMKLDRP